MKVVISRVDPELPLPAYHTPGAVAFDLYTREDATIAPREYKLLPSNLVIAVPKGHALVLAARSSLAKKGLMLPNGIGVIDVDYHGPDDEIGILVYNFTADPIAVGRGDRLTQGLIIPVLRAEWEEVPRDTMKKVSRGGFGSTG